MLDYLFDTNPEALVIISLAIIIVAGFLMSRLTKVCRLPNVTGYILAGILIGPYVLNIIPASILPSFNFLTDIAVAFIAFGVGKYINLTLLKSQGKKALIITLFESILAGLLIYVFMFFLFGLSWQVSLLLSAIACCTAPTSTLMTIRQYRASGNFVDSLVQVIALDNVIGLLAFNVCLVIVQGSSQAISVGTLLLPILYTVLTIALGIGLGLLLKKLFKERYSMDSRLIMTFAIIFTLTAVCCFLNISPLLPCMALGATYVTAKGNNEVFKVVGSFTPPILLIFFVVSGMKFDITMLLSIGLVGLAYFFIRMLGKMVGSYLGGVVTKSSADTRKFLGLALIPQAGVSIGLVAISSRALPTDVASLITTIILTSAILYELVGPATAKYAIFSCAQIDSSTISHRKTLTPIEKYIKEMENKKGKLGKQKFDKIKLDTNNQENLDIKMIKLSPPETQTTPDLENDMLEDQFAQINAKIHQENETEKVEEQNNAEESAENLETNQNSSEDNDTSNHH